MESERAYADEGKAEEHERIPPRHALCDSRPCAKQADEDDGHVCECVDKLGDDVGGGVVELAPVCWPVSTNAHCTSVEGGM